MDIKQTPMLVFLAFLIFAAGGVVGILYQAQGGIGQLAGQDMSGTVRQLSSKVVPSIAAYGIVTNISGRTVTLTAQSDSMVITVRKDAQIYSFVPSASDTAQKNTSSSRKITLADVKPGDNASINIKVLPMGQIEATSVIILPPALSPMGK